MKEHMKNIRVILYSTPTCPNCDVLKKKLDREGVEYEVNQNIEEMKSLGIRSVPVVKIGNELLYFNDILNNINKLKTIKEPIDARKLMSDAKFYEGYARYIESENRYETWKESVERVIKTHRTYYRDKIKSNKELDDLIEEVAEGYKEKLFLGSQRTLQFAGEQLLKKHERGYNCSASHCDRPNFFGGYFFLLLAGAGVGLSLQKHHVNKLPNIKKRTNHTKTYIVPDSIEGWANTIDVLLSSYFVDNQVYPEYAGKKVNFDLSQIRPYGAYISGGFKAPGPEPLRKALDLVETKIEQALREGIDKLRPIHIYDICMYIADCVISGSIRRSATICLFSKDDEEMLKAKTGNWFVENPQRGRSNNSVVLVRNEITREEFKEIIKSVKDYGEPGFIFVDSAEFVFNPCAEVGFMTRLLDGRSGFSMCNLTEINGAKSTTKDMFFKQCKLSAIVGTIQAGYTDFKFFKDDTKALVEKEALIGVGITGFMNNPDILLDPEILKEGARIVKEWNEKVSKMLGINQAARTTVVKPSGNSSVLLGCASGIHGEHSKRYIRHVQTSKDSEVGKLFMEKNPNMCEPSVGNKDRDIVIAFPIDNKTNSKYKKDLMGVKQLEAVKLVQKYWVEEGTNVELCNHPKLRNNVSNTITVDDWDEVTDYIYNNREYFAGVSLLARVGDKNYPQAPFTEILTHHQIVEKYGEVAMFTSALIEAGLNAFDNDLWLACSTAMGNGLKLREDHFDLLKRDFVRRVKKFATNFKGLEECVSCLKDVYNLHKVWKIQMELQDINWGSELLNHQYTDVDTLGATGCSGGKCEI